jgi:hypothetical protein
VTQPVASSIAPDRCHSRRTDFLLAGLFELDLLRIRRSGLLTVIQEGTRGSARRSDLHAAQAEPTKAWSGGSAVEASAGAPGGAPRRPARAFTSLSGTLTLVLKDSNHGRWTGRKVITELGGSMTGPRLLWFGLAGVLGLSGLGGTAGAATPQAVRVPANLCTLKVKLQLAGLHVASACKPAKAAKIGALTILGANWGSVDNSVGVQVYEGGSKASFAAEFGGLGSPVALGSFGREATGASGATVAAWVSGVGLVANLNHPGDPDKNKAYAAPMFALAKAVVKQL